MICSNRSAASPVLTFVTALLPALLAAQQPTVPDTALRDSVQHLEPAPGINVYVGAELGWRVLK
jgi:hypothetical protein